MNEQKIRIVGINKEPVELYKILKFENFAASGGEAKHMILKGLVSLNGVVETIKRKKIFHGDMITIGDDTIEIQKNN
jgi:ribosome-associated protein